MKMRNRMTLNLVNTNLNIRNGLKRQYFEACHDYDWDSRSNDHGKFYGYGLLFVFHITQLISRNNTKSHRRPTKPLSVNIRANENTGSSLVCNENNTAESCVNANNRDWFCRMRFQFTYFHDYVFYVRFYFCFSLVYSGLFFRLI